MVCKGKEIGFFARNLSEKQYLKPNKEKKSYYVT